MDDSGFDSEDKQSTLFDDLANGTTITNAQHTPDLEVTFRGAATVSSVKDLSTPQSSPEDTESSLPEHGAQRQVPNTCRILQRKLEMKVERAKRNYTQYQADNCKKSQSANLIPIDRLPIPGEIQVKPLVDYKSDSSEDVEEISFFPAKLKNAKKLRNHELSDTFSIQEMTIESDAESERSGSPSLELLLPNTKFSLIERLKNCFWCI